MHEKTGEIKPGVTPVDYRKDTDKKASVEDLESHPSKDAEEITRDFLYREYLRLRGSQKKSM